jgi:hypothetical protein
VVGIILAASISVEGNGLISKDAGLLVGWAGVDAAGVELLARVTKKAPAKWMR